jgi:hypothetical protein
MKRKRHAIGVAFSFNRRMRRHPQQHWRASALSKGGAMKRSPRKREGSFTMLSRAIDNSVHRFGGSPKTAVKSLEIVSA